MAKLRVSLCLLLGTILFWYISPVIALQQTIQAGNTTHAFFYNGTASEVSHTVAVNVGTLRTTGIANVDACDDSRNRVAGSSSADSIWRVNYSVGKVAGTGTINWIWVYGEIRDIDTSYGDYYHLEERNATEAAWVDLNVTTTRSNVDVPYRFNVTGVNVSRFVSGSGSGRWLNLVMRGWGTSADTLELDCLYVTIDYTPPSACATFAVAYPAGQTIENITATDLTGNATENQTAPAGQTAAIPMYSYDNQCASGTQTWTMQLDSNLDTAKLRRKVSQNASGYQAACSGNTATGCAYVETTSAVTINSSISNIGAVDARAWVWADFTAAFPSDSVSKTLTHTSISN